MPSRLIKFRINNTAFIIPVLLIAIFSTTACEKNEHPGNPATVQLFNGMDDGERLYANLSEGAPDRYGTLLNIGNKSYLLRNNLIHVNQFPPSISFYTLTDTLPEDNPVLQTTPDLAPGSVYSMFIYGTKEAAGYFLNQDEIPAIDRGDSTTHLRVVNLSQDMELSVNVKGEPHGSFIDKLAFKEISSFMKLSTDQSVTQFEFEFRDFTTGDLVASFVRSNAYINNVAHPFYARANSLVFVGKQGGSGANQPNVILMNHR